MQICIWLFGAAWLLFVAGFGPVDLYMVVRLVYQAMHDFEKLGAVEDRVQGCMLRLYVWLYAFSVKGYDTDPQSHIYCAV